MIGYGLAAATRPLFPLADSVALVFTARFIDRIGKDILEAPRDTLIIDVTPAHSRGPAYGLRQSLDTVGAAAGPLLAIAFMLLLEDDIRTVLWIALVPHGIAVAVLVYGVREPSNTDNARAARWTIRAAQLRRLGSDYWWLLALAGRPGKGPLQRGLLILRAVELGLAIAFVPVAMVVMNVVYTLSDNPAGRLSDAVGRRGLLACGVALLIAGDVLLALVPDVRVVMGGVVLWGRHMDSARASSRPWWRTSRLKRCAARHGVWHLQPRGRGRAAAGKRAHRLAVGHPRSGGHLGRRRRLARRAPT